MESTKTVTATRTASDTKTDHENRGDTDVSARGRERSKCVYGASGDFENAASALPTAASSDSHLAITMSSAIRGHHFLWTPNSSKWARSPTPFRDRSGLRGVWMHNEARHLQPVRDVLPAQPDPPSTDSRSHQHGLTCRRRPRDTKLRSAKREHGDRGPRPAQGPPAGRVHPAVRPTALPFLRWGGTLWRWR